MSRSTEPKIPPAPDGHNRSARQLRAPRRDEIEARPTRWLKRGGPTKADLRVVDSAAGPLVVKDFRDKPGWVRLIGRLQIRRECRAYAWLGSIRGLPRFAGRVDAHALALELIDGEPLTRAALSRGGGVAAYARLREIVGRMHAAGVFHLDLRGRDNVLMTAAGEVVILDLAAALCLRQDRPLARLLSRWPRVTDEAALLKWKDLLGAGPFTAGEAAFLRRYRFWRALWVFNPKRRRAG